MKKLFMVPVFVLILIVVLAGCSSSTTSTTPAAIPNTSTVPATTAPQTKPATTTAAATTAPATSAKPTTPAASAAPSNKNYGGTLRTILATVPGSPIGWMPETSGINANQQQISLDTLLWEDINGNMIPHLAESYDLVSDPTNPSITFHLRKGVKFQDGSDMNAQAVKADFDQVKASPVSAGTTGVWKSVDVVDDYTVRVNYTKWQNQQIRSYATSTTMIYSPAAFQKNGIDWMRWHMVGTGPFSQSNYQQDVILAGTKNPYYWEQGKPYVDGVQFIYVADEMTQNALFKTGGGDILQCTPKTSVELQAQGYQIISRLRNTNMLLPDSMNADSPWANPKVRMAAEYAIDREAIAKTFGYGYYKAAYQVPVPGNPAFVTTIVGHKYDPAKAKQLLTDAGYPNGFKTSIIAGTTTIDINTAYQAYFAAVGIQASLDIADPARGQQLMAGGTWHNALLNSGTVTYANFNNILAQWFGSPSIFFKSTKKPDGWDALINASFASPKPDPVLMQKCAQALYDDSTVITTVYDTAQFAVTNQVHDAGLGAYGSFSAWDPASAWLSKP